MAGAYLVYVGIRDVPVVDGLRDLLDGRQPEGKAVKLDLGRAVHGASAGFGLATAPAPTGNIVSVPGTSIRVDASIASQVGQMVAAAKAAGITLNGGGYRSSLEQAALRITNRCTCSDRSDCCSPPTAPVGQSMHEKGLAIDFSGMTTTSPSYRWMQANASKYGLKNLPGEAWHWSTNGK